MDTPKHQPQNQTTPSIHRTTQPCTEDCMLPHNITKSLHTPFADLQVQVPSISAHNQDIFEVLSNVRFFNPSYELMPNNSVASTDY
jgi:hypothetical protein